MTDRQSSERVLRITRLVLGLARLAEPRTVLIGAALATGELCRRFAPDNLETVLSTVRRAHALPRKAA